jgi:CAAX protease family protein
MAASTIELERADRPDDVTTRRRRGAGWRVLAAVEVLIAVAAVVASTVNERIVPALVIAALAALSLLVRWESPATLGFRRIHHGGRMAVQVLGLTAVWSVVQLGLIMPVLNHATGSRQDLSDFSDLQGNVGMLLGLVALSWLYAALFEELAFRGFVPTRVRDIFGSGSAGLIAAVAVSATLFGLCHTEQGAIGVVVTFFDALFFIWLRYRYDTLWASVLAHGFNNTLGLIAFFLIGPIYGLW